MPCETGSCPSGYCECKDGVKKHPVSCKIGSHAPFTCQQFCGPRAAATAGHSNGTHAQAQAQATATAASWWTSAVITPNNMNFPASGLPTTNPKGGPANLPSNDLAAVLTGIYGSAPGCLCTFPNSPACPGIQGKGEKLGQIATTIARSRRVAHTLTWNMPLTFCTVLNILT